VTPRRSDFLILCTFKYSDSLTPRFPCHSDVAERCVEAITEAATSVVGAQAQDGFIRACLVARKIMPTFETKSDFRTE